MAANKIDQLNIQLWPTELWSNSNVRTRYCLPEDHAQSCWLLFFASSFSGIGLFFAVVCLIGCNGLAASGRPSIASSANSQLKTTANLPVGTIQSGYRTTGGQVSSGLTLNPVTLTPKAAPPMRSNPVPLQIMTDGLPDGTMQGNYTTRLVANGGVPPYYWDATAGQIAPGLTLRSSAGTISGIPFAPGAFSFTARVHDSTGSSLSTTLSLNISAALPPIISDVVSDADSVDGGTVMMISDQSRIRR
jgi:hypothetical protein